MRLFIASFERLCIIFLYISIASLAAMAVLVVLAVAMRYFVHRPFDATEELVGLLYMVATFSAIPLVSLNRRHIVVGILSENVGPAVARILLVGASLVFIAFMGWLALATYQMTVNTARFAGRTEQVGFLLWPWMTLMLVAIVIALIADVVRTSLELAGGLDRLTISHVGRSGGDI